MEVKGFAAEEAERAYAQAWKLCQQLGEASQRFQDLFRLWALYLVRAEIRRAYELARQLLSLTEGNRRWSQCLQAHFVLGGSLFCLGEFTQARQHWDQAIALYRHPQRRKIKGVEFGVYGKVCMTYALWALGYRDQGRTQSQEALTLAGRV